MSRCAIYRVVLSVALTLAVTASCFGGFAESFKAGIRAWDYKDWPEVVDAMRQAIREQPRATGENVRIYGTRVVPYIPHYFLGLGLYRQGDCDGARRAFAEAAAQGGVRGLYRARLDFIHDLCTQRLGLPKVPTAPAIHSQATSPSPPQPSADPPPPPGTVRQKALEETARKGREWIVRGRKLVQQIAERRRSDPRRFDRDPTRAEILAVAEQRIQAAEFQLRGCQIEGDLEGAERAHDDAQAAWEMLDELMKSL